MTIPDQILQLLTKKGRLDTTQIVDHLTGWTEGSVRAALYRLQSDGRVAGVRGDNLRTTWIITDERPTP